MGLSVSSNKEEGNAIEKQYSKHELVKLFQLRVSLLFSATELAAISQRLLSITGQEENLSSDQLTKLLLWDLDISNLTMDSEDAASLLKAFNILYESFAVLGQLPFLRDAISTIGTPKLNSKQFLKSIAVYTGRIAKIWPNCDLLALFFVSLATSLMKMTEKDANPPEQFVVKTTMDVDHRQKEMCEDMSRLSKRIQWRSFRILTTFDTIDITTLTVPYNEFHLILTYLLIIESLTLQKRDKMIEEYVARLSNDWKNYSSSATSLLKFLDPENTPTRMKTANFSLESLRHSSQVGIPSLIILSMNKLFKYGFLLAKSSSVPNNHEENNNQNEIPAVHCKAHTFCKTRLVNFSTVTILSMALSTVDSAITISPENLVELYNGSKSGFLIRSLESKIFKWQAATILLVSGRRLRAKTMENNRRYQEFDSQYPRFFRSAENRNRRWQSDSDVVTYAVYLNHPWVNSNKNNFGNESTCILSLLPNFDLFTSRKDLVLDGKLVYFNNLGMGLGFGNSQPINKNNTRKFLPGTVSLTIESNLEFAVFRHVPNAGFNLPQYFNTSKNLNLSSEDYEDRFMITDLEVWGVGSTKELEEQRKEWEWEEKQALARQSVNFRDLGEDRAFLEMAGLVGNHAGGGSI